MSTTTVLTIAALAMLASSQQFPQQSDLSATKLDFDVNSSQPYTYNCIGCLRGGYNYYCDYSGSYNTGNCDSTSFFWCTTEWHLISSCKNSFGGWGNVDFSNQNPNTWVWKYNNVEVRSDRWDIYLKMVAGDRVKLVVKNTG